MDNAVKYIIELINPETKHGLKFLTSLCIVILLTLFVKAYVFPIPAVDKIFHQLNLSDWIFALLMFIIIYIITLFLTSNDTFLYSTNSSNKYIQAFRRHWPSQHIANRNKGNKRKAANLWFREFNKWKDDTHDKYIDRKTTFARGYACRFVYYIQVFCLRMFWLTILWLVFELIAFMFIKYIIINIEAKLAILVMFLSIWLLLKCFNRIDENCTTGVWKRFNEINEQHCNWIDEHPELFKSDD